MAFDKEKRDEQQATDRTRDGSRFDQAVDNASERGGCEKSARPIELHARVLRAAFRYACEDQQHHQRNRQVDEERPPPRSVLHEPSTQYRTDSRSDGRETRPGTDRAAPLLARERSADQR